jgi:hypothetical protein
VQPLNDGIEAAAKNDDRKVDLAELVRIMGDAATVDLRGYRVLPVLLEVIGDAGTDRLRNVVELLKAWNASGAHRRDENADGQYEYQAAIAVMDAWWPEAVEAVFGPVLGDAFDEIPVTLDDAAGDPPGPRGSDHNGSSFNDGFYGHVDKELRSILGKPVQGAFARKYCGEGSAPLCRAALLESLNEAVTTVETAQGTDPAAWDADEALDEIRYVSVGVSGIPPIPWQNRPTFQQVLEFRGPGSGGGGGKGNEIPAACLNTPKSGITQVLGTEGADRLKGTAGPDIVCGFGGRDTLVGLDGDDEVFGGGGNDLLKGGAGKDRLVGARGQDRLNGGPGEDVLSAGPSRDRCRGGPARDRLRSCERGRP